MGLAREDELGPSLGVLQQRPQVVEIGHEERRPLVGGEAASESDGERVRMEQALGGCDPIGRLPPPSPRERNAPADKASRRTFST